MARVARTVAIIQARMGSTRLPGKMLMDLVGYPLLWHVVTRVRQAQTIDGVAVATSHAAADDAIETYCHMIGCECWRGSETDVLGRFHGAAQAAQADVIVRISGDCPLISGEEIDRVVRYRGTRGWWYVSNCHPPCMPDGLDVEVMVAAALEWANDRAIRPSDREHVTPWLRRILEDWTSLTASPDLSHIRLCVDTPEDLEAMRQIMAIAGSDCIWRDALDVLATHPEIAALNQHIERNASYKKQVAKEQKQVEGEEQNA